MSILHPESAGYYAQTHESQAFIQMSGMGVGFHDGIELKNQKAEFRGLGNAVQNKLLTDMLTTAF